MSDIRAALERLVEAFGGHSWDATERQDAIAAARAALAAEPVGEGLEPTHEQVSQWINANPVLRPGSTGGPMIRVGTDWLATFADAARWGAQFRPTAPPAPEPGEVGELVVLLTLGSDCGGGAKLSPQQCRRAATLLQQQAAPAPDQVLVHCPETCWIEIRRIADGKVIYSNYRKGDLRLSIDEPSAEPPAPAGGLVERLAGVWNYGQPLHPAAARAAIREVAEWLDERGMHGCSLWLREEADRCP